MDGAIILASTRRDRTANVHLVPKASIPTSETGTRHRTAERVARSIDVPVIAVSEAMATIAVYRNDSKHVTQTAGWLIDRSSQALSTLQRFRSRYDDALSTLTRLEMEDSVSVRDVWRCCSRARWSAVSPRRSRATWWSWAPTAGSSTSRPRS